MKTDKKGNELQFVGLEMLVLQIKCDANISFSLQVKNFINYFNSRINTSVNYTKQPSSANHSL